jgi:hypothetical protein
MIIELDNKSTITGVKADAVLMVVDNRGHEKTGHMKYWLDIAQVVEMMGLCGQLSEESLYDFETETAHIYVVTESGAVSMLPKVLDLCTRADVKSINVPSVASLDTEIWGIESDSDVLVRICGK